MFYVWIQIRRYGILYAGMMWFKMKESVSRLPQYIEMFTDKLADNV